MPRQVRDDQAASGQVRQQLCEVPGRAAVAVDEEQRRPVTADERPDPGATMLVDPLFEAGEKIRRIRHLDRLWFDHCEFDSDKAGGMRKLPALRPDQPEIQAR